ncbi:hypothetical protein BKA70DRAFT_1447162 [Coprinopsis sp. MPI-PUGE-AT-0042]|nr:hypothetical protein BKA70DRAFT_1447162 [Coprinopsis sp. MPI-PUGE-AT-0042]
MEGLTPALVLHALPPNSNSAPLEQDDRVAITRRDELIGRILREEEEDDCLPDFPDLTRNEQQRRLVLSGLARVLFLHDIEALSTDEYTEWSEEQLLAAITDKAAVLRALESEFQQLKAAEEEFRLAIPNIKEDMKVCFEQRCAEGCEGVCDAILEIMKKHASQEDSQMFGPGFP